MHLCAHLVFNLKLCLLIVTSMDDVNKTIPAVCSLTLDCLGARNSNVSCDNMVILECVNMNILHYKKNVGNLHYCLIFVFVCVISQLCSRSCGVHDIKFFDAHVKVTFVVWYGCRVIVSVPLMPVV